MDVGMMMVFASYGWDDIGDDRVWDEEIRLGRLAAGATHEISNPLTAILGYSELLTDIPSLSPPDRQSAQNIQRQVHHAQAAVNSLRNSLRNPDSPLPISADERANS